MSTILANIPLCEAIHENAVKHGFWEEDEPDIDTIFDLFHCEISEAFEEYRAGHCLTEIYYTPDRPDKPEGVPVELADLAIRIVDYAMHTYYGLENLEDPYINYPNKIERLTKICAGIDFSHLICFLHLVVTKAYLAETGLESDDGSSFENLYSALVVISTWFETNNLNLEKVVELKHEYNKTRPYKHGKLC